MNKHIHLISSFTVFAATLITQSSHAGVTFEKAEVIGCGTIISIRGLDHEPMKDLDFYRFESENKKVSQTSSQPTGPSGGPMQSGGTFVQLANGNVIGWAAAVIGSNVYNMIADRVNTPTPDVKTTTDIPGERFGKKIFAIKVKMDDGREVNLPMIERFPSKNGFAFTEGHRFPLSYSGIGFELNFGGDGHAPIPDATDYSDVCGVRMPETIVNRAIKIFGRAVKEDKVLPSPEVVPSKAASMNTNIYE